MNIKLLTYFVIPLMGISLLLVLPSFSLDSVLACNDPLCEIERCCNCCAPGSSGENSSDCGWVENWDDCNRLREFIIDGTWKMQSTKIPVLRGSSGSHNEPDKSYHFPNPTFQLPSKTDIEIIAGVAITPQSKPHTIGGKLNGVKVSIEFLDSKGKTISKVGQQPMASVAMHKKTGKLTQKIDERTSFSSINLNEIGYFKMRPDFGKFEVKGVQTGTMVVNVLAKDKMGKYKAISTTKSTVRYADPVSFEKLMNK